MTETTITISGDGITVSSLVWRRYRRPMPGLVEAVLDRNPGLAGLGALIPVGTRVVIPSVEDVVAADPEAISLYD